MINDLAVFLSSCSNNIAKNGIFNARTNFFDYYNKHDHHHHHKERKCEEFLIMELVN